MKDEYRPRHAAMRLSIISHRNIMRHVECHRKSRTLNSLQKITKTAKALIELVLRSGMLLLNGVE